MCRQDVIVATREATVASAAKLMRHHHVGSVVVVRPMNGGLDVPVGIVTDRDIVVDIVATDLDANVITVGDIMPGELVTVRADQGLLEAVQLMRVKGVRRLPVVTEDRQLVGLVALDDLLEALTEPLVDLSKVFTREQSREAAHRK
jgi:CBS domain-containing protein